MSFFSPDALLTHIQEFIPRVSDRFSNIAAVSAEIIDGDPQTLRVTDTSHGKSVGDIVVFVDSKINNPITAVEFFEDPIAETAILRFTTDTPHDLTRDYNSTIELSGFTDTGLNGEFTVVGVPSRTTFEIDYDTEPTLTGSENLVESWELGLDGLFAIQTVVDSDTYEVSLEGKPTFAHGTIPSIYRSTSFRGGVVVDAERARAIYTKQPDKTSLWCFVIMGDSSASKDREILSDATQANTAQNPSRILMINTFSLIVFFPTDNELTGGDASQLAWDEILKVMLSVAAGIRFDDFGNTQYRTALINHGTGIYNNAYYTHVYEFEYDYEVTAEETHLTKFIQSRAYRDSAISLGGISGDLNQDGGEDLT